MAVLYGVGVGSGDPDLLTIKAVKILKECDVIAIPSEDPKKSVAYKIVAKAIPEIACKELMGIGMPMTMDGKALEEAHIRGAAWVIQKLEEGKSVAFITLGDSTIYSTYTYIKERIEAAGYETQIISGITSFLSAAAAINIDLVARDEELHVIPSAYSIGRAMELPGTKVFMKAGKRLTEIKNAVDESNQSIYFVENLGIEDEHIIEGVENIPDTAGYYSMVIVKEGK